MNPSPELQPLLMKLESALQENPQDLQNIKAAILSVLEFLCNPQGRTDANCRDADVFLLLAGERGVHWSDLPEAYQTILSDMGGQLHDTFGAPAIAENFHSTPEQLLERSKELDA